VRLGACPYPGLPERVEVVEVGPRDGLQNEPRAVPAEARARLVRELAAAGLGRIEAGAFVAPRWVPQMADAERLFQELADAGLKAVRLSALVPNLKGLERALASGVREVAVFAAASESFSRRNLNASIGDSLARYRPVVAEARAQGLRVRGYVSCIGGCPYEGEVDPARVAAVADALYRMGCEEIALGDTIGTATPGRIRKVVLACSARLPKEALALHLHDTYGQALANAFAGLMLGIRVFDAAIGGLGGCPYAPGAAGNLATEDLLYLLDGLGIHTGVDRDRLRNALLLIRDELGLALRSRVARTMLADPAPPTSA